MKKLKTIIGILILVLIAVIIALICVNDSHKGELVSIKTENQLKQIYEGKELVSKNIAKYVLTMPYSYWAGNYSGIGSSITMKESTDYYTMNSTGIISPDSVKSDTQTTQSSTSSKDYSTTNIQVENVDEADITKTDGDYIYSISENKVIITNVKDPQNISIVATIDNNNSSSVIPEELMLYQNKLAVIYTESLSNSSYYRGYSKNNTIVEIYNIANKEAPKLEKEYTLYEPYYTSRCIGNKLYVISSGDLREENGEIVTYYKENTEKKEIGMDHIKYLRDLLTRNQTLISMVNLDTEEDVQVNSYLMNIENAYVSENSIYLLNEKYEGEDIKISSIFGLKGIFGAFDDESYQVGGRYTEIYKFNILEDGTIQYHTRTKEKGKTINQFSLDEYQNNLRVALYDEEGSRVVVFDDKLERIGQTENLAKGETMYSSRFLGSKAYLVTYRTVDPLYVIDLSNPTNPRMIGELKIPGYSTYLHPYDENHLIGIGMATKEVVNRNSLGRVTSTTAKITGMKMALFDVSDVNNPVQISSTIIGDSRTTSAILTNHKALLFSKEKEVIAIPVNNYSEDFLIESSSDNNQMLTQSYQNYDKEYISEGYLVYHINLEDGFKLKGIINHDKTNTKSKYRYYSDSKLLRGMYINDNLFTVSEGAIKVNRLDDLAPISELKIRK